MIGLLAEKFIPNQDILQRIKEMMDVGIIFQMMREDGVKEGKKEGSIEIAKNLLKKGSPVDFVSEVTGLDEPTIISLQAELAIA